MRCSWARSLWPGALAAVCLWTGIGLAAQTPAPPPAPVPTSAPTAKELVTTLLAKKLEAFAVKDPAQVSRFIAVLHVPNVQLLVVAANYERATDIEYRIYQKDFQGAYADLRSGIMSSNRVLVEDALCDGLVALPPKGQPVSDTVTMLSGKRSFDGDIADPKKKNDKRITREDYLKTFTTADTEYQHLLMMLLSGLRQVGPGLGTGAAVR